MRKHIFEAAIALGLMVAASAHAQIDNPLPEPITNHGLAVQIRELVRLPDSSALDPSETTALTLARAIDPDGRSLSDLLGPDAERARTHALPTATIDHRDWPTREAYDAQVVDRLRACDVELVVLAGFNRLLSPVFVRAFPMRIINIHPALLPSFPGLHAQRQAVDYGVRIAGATVHFVDEETDHGPIIIQAAVPAYPHDTEDTLQARILEQEHRIYPEAIRLLAEGRIRIEGRRITAVGATADQAWALVNPRVDE